MVTAPDSTLREARAVGAMVSVMRALGPEVGQPRVIRSENNVVAIVNDSIVAKAIESSRGNALRKEASILVDLHDFAESVTLAPMTNEAIDVDGWTVILLSRLREVSPVVTTSEMHKSLRRLHHALSGLVPDLVRWDKQLSRTIDVWKSNPFTGDAEQTAKDALEQFVLPALGYTGPVQVLHGDAWSGQVMRTAEGLKWFDFETASIGPKEWDLAASDVVEGYGPYDETLWRHLKLVRSWTVAVWSNVNAQHSPQLQHHVDLHIDRLAQALRAK